MWDGIGKEQLLRMAVPEHVHLALRMSQQHQDGDFVAWHVYTDDSAHLAGQNPPLAGWAFAVPGETRV
eukprot:14897565-Alexandrium_andersonii.AAC.1